MALQPSTQTKTTSVKLDVETYRKFKSICAAEGVSVKDAINRLITNFVNRKK